MKTPVKEEKSWAGKTYDKMTGKDDELEEDVAKSAAEKKPPVSPEKLAEEEAAAQRKAEEEEEAKRAPGRKAGAKYVDEQDYPGNNEIVLASIPTIGMMLLQYRYAPNSVSPKDAAKGDFYASIAGSYSSLVGKVNAWMSIPEF